MTSPTKPSARKVWTQDWENEYWRMSGKDGVKRSYIYPEYEKEKHLVKTTQCPCRPRLEIIHGILKLIHSAFDGRDLIEEAEELVRKDKP